MKKLILLILVAFIMNSCGETCYTCKMEANIMGSSVSTPAQEYCSGDFKDKKQFKRAIENLEKSGQKCTKN